MKEIKSKLTELSEQKVAANLQTMSKKSYQWLQDNIGKIKNPAPISKDIAKEKDRYTRRFLLGGMYFFYYNPEGKRDLPYYDIFPLVIPIQRYPDGFLGVNLHYLPIKYRILLMNKLMPLAIFDENDDPKRLKVSYDILSASRRYIEFRPCIKRYKLQAIRSKILTVRPNEWDIAVALPIQQFRKAPARKVWAESIQDIKEKKNAS